MALELKTTNLEEIKALAEEMLNRAESAETMDAKRAAEADLEEVINYYAGISKAHCYAEAKASGDPMKFAITRFFFPVIKVKETKDKDTEIVIRSIADAERPIDLGDLHKKLGGIGSDKNWLYAAEKFNFYLTVRAAGRVGAVVNSDAMVMNEIAKAFDMGKNPCSNTQLLKTLQLVVTMMLGEGYKANSHDVNYLVDVYSNDNKKSKTGITAANHKTLRNYLKKVCYRILTNGDGYEVQQKDIKD